MSRWDWDMQPVPDTIFDKKRNGLAIILHAKTYDFKVAHLAAIDSEADKCALRVPSLHACCARIDVQKSEVIVVHDFEYV